MKVSKCKRCRYYNVRKWGQVDGRPAHSFAYCTKNEERCAFVSGRCPEAKKYAQEVSWPES